MKTLGIIPARFASTRFPGKPLALIGGKTMLQRVFEQVGRATLLQEIVIATDDERIFNHAIEFGAKAFMTRSDHQSGTDRCAEVAHSYPLADVIVNIQGDEPFIDPSQIDAVIAPFAEQSEINITTLGKRITDPDTLFSPNAVKVVKNQFGHALYFSRHPIPFLRGLELTDWISQKLHFKHLGIYGYRRDTLLKISLLQPSLYERAESLEQLRWLEAGYKIYVGETHQESIGIDTPEDLEKVKKQFEL